MKNTTVRVLSTMAVMIVIEFSFFLYPHFLLLLVVLPFRYLPDPNPAHAESQ